MSAAKKSQRTTAKQTAKKAAKRSAAKQTTEGAPEQAAPKKTAKKAARKAADHVPAKKAAKKTVKHQTTPAPAADAEPADHQVRTASEQAELRAALKERLDELVAEQQRFVDSIAVAQRERLSDTAGDDQVDSGSKTVEHEHEVTVANAIAERIRQVSHALDRVDAGDYGICEKCGKPIPAARLAAFPSATLCVSCKQLEERR
ncbi:MAG TPA: TraR/DksA family transcriptional regulator [Glycomyces sp.]|nr:TraR/DksA family transcriptional regulator [Glycomyces sp.]